MAKQENRQENCNVAIVGGGTAGLALACELKRLGVDSVVVLERENHAGGVPRHCGHYPFGLRELKRVLKGPEYARALVKNALDAGVEIRTQTSVNALHPNAKLSLSDPNGLYDLQATRVVLATGVRESSRAQRFISGARPQGVITTGALQSMVYLHGQRPFRHPVILGSELVSFSAIMTCQHMGIRPVAMVEENSRVTARAILRPYPALRGIAMHFGALNLRIHGHRLVEAISFDTPNGTRQTIETDGVIISGHFRPEAALLHASHLLVDPASGGPSIDQYGRASDPTYFCTGNLLRPVETSSWCWHEAVEAAARIASDLNHPAYSPPNAAPHVALNVEDPRLRFVVPQRLALTDRPGAMTQMQMRLTGPASGHLSASVGRETFWSSYIESRPERRVLAPLAPMIKAASRGNIGLRIL